MNQKCKVCGEPAAGFHFGAFTCEGCKSFFGRTYSNVSAIQECKHGGNCVIDKKNRTSCKACRLRKCLLVGMSKSGSRYGRRSNWFKIHCLLQEQTGLSMDSNTLYHTNSPSPAGSQTKSEPTDDPTPTAFLVLPHNGKPAPSPTLSSPSGSSSSRDSSFNQRDSSFNQRACPPIKSKRSISDTSFTPPPLTDAPSPDHTNDLEDAFRTAKRGKTHHSHRHQQLHHHPVSPKAGLLAIGSTSHSYQYTQPSPESSHSDRDFNDFPGSARPPLPLPSSHPYYHILASHQPRLYTPPLSSSSRRLPKDLEDDDEHHGHVVPEQDTPIDLSRKSAVCVRAQAHLLTTSEFLHSEDEADDPMATDDTLHPVLKEEMSSAPLDLTMRS